jgi:hypothetical protein
VVRCITGSRKGIPGNKPVTRDDDDNNNNDKFRDIARITKM